MVVYREIVKNLGVSQIDNCGEICAFLSDWNGFWHLPLATIEEIFL